MISSFKWGILGASKFALEQMAPAIHSAKGNSLVALATRDLEKANKFLELSDRLVIYNDYNDLLEDSNVDAVYIHLPNHIHIEWATLCLQAGKHVLCEKPLAMDSKESAALVELSAAHPELAAGVNYNIRCYPLCIEAREMIAAGDLGEVLHITGSYTQDWLSKPTDYNWRVLADEGGQLRAVADIGTHWFDLMMTLTGLELEAVCADLKTVFDVRRRPVGEVETFSKDSVESHIKFIKKYNLEIELISDPDIKLIKDLGSWVKKSMYGKEYMGVERSTFLIDQNNKIVEIL